MRPFAMCTNVLMTRSCDFSKKYLFTLELCCTQSRNFAANSLLNSPSPPLKFKFVRDVEFLNFEMSLVVMLIKKKFGTKKLYFNNF